MTEKCKGCIYWYNNRCSLTTCPRVDKTWKDDTKLKHCFEMAGINIDDVESIKEIKHEQTTS